MHIRVRDTTDVLQLLIISDDEGLAFQITEQASMAAYTATVATSTHNLHHLIEVIHPDVIVGIETNTLGSHFLGKIALSLDIIPRPILIIVSNFPQNNLFSIADQVIPTSYLIHIGQIIASLVERSQKAASLEQRCTNLETENLQVHRELAEAERITSEFGLLKQAIVHNVSHELRTPMLQVKSAVALLSEDKSTNHTIAELAMEATTRLESGIRNVTLLHELMNENSNEHTFTSTPIMQIIQAAIRNLGRSWEHKENIKRIENTSGDKNRLVLCDKQRMSMAIQLLLDNALKFSKGKVIVNLTDGNNQVTISIQDHGIGISKDQINHIFEPFYQVDGSSTRRFGGMGIGLAIVRLILDQHNASIEIDSELGKGSTFAFDLPLSID